MFQVSVEYMLNLFFVPLIAGMVWYHICIYLYLFFMITFKFPAQLVGGFTLSDLLDKPRSQVSSLLPLGTCLQILSRIGFSIPTARRFPSNVAASYCLRRRLSLLVGLFLHIKRSLLSFWCQRYSIGLSLIHI